MKHLLRTLIAFSALLSAQVQSEDDLFPLTAPQADRSREAARIFLLDYISEKKENPNVLLAHYEECDVFDGLVSVTVYPAAELEKPNPVRGAPEGFSGMFWIDADEGTLVREMALQ